MSTGVKVTAEGSGKSLPTNLAGVAGVPGTGDNVDWEDGGGAPGSIPGSGNFETKNEGGNPTVKAHGSTGATETIDPTDGNVHTLTLNANCTFTLNVPAGTSATLELWITQDGTGGWAITWPVSVTVVGTLDTTLSTTSIVVLTTVNTGTSWVAVVVGSGGSSLTVKDEGGSLTTAATSIDFVGSGVTASGITAAKTVTIPGPTVATIDALGYVGPILIADSPSTPLVFADLLQNDAQDDLMYADL